MRPFPTNKMSQFFCFSKNFSVTITQYYSRAVSPFGTFIAEPGISGLEKTAPPGELEFSSRSN